MGILQRAIMQDAPAVYWTMLAVDANGTTMRDISGNGRDGVIAGSPVFTESIFGNSCLNFDGSNDTVTRANDAALNAGTGQWCMEWWMKTNYSDGNYMNTVGRDASGSGDGPLYYTKITTGIQHAWCGQGNSVGSINMTDGVLRHVVFQREAAGAVRTYVNGVVDSAANITNNSAVLASSALQVAETTAYQRFVGLLAHFAFWAGSSLPQSRITAHYQAGLRSGVMY